MKEDKELRTQSCSQLLYTLATVNVCLLGLQHITVTEVFSKPYQYTAMINILCLYTVQTNLCVPFPLHVLLHKKYLSNFCIYKIEW